MAPIGWVAGHGWASLQQLLNHFLASVWGIYPTEAFRQHERQNPILLLKVYSQINCPHL